MRQRALSISLFSTTSSFLLLLPQLAFANHGVSAMGAGLEILFIAGIIYLLLLLTASLLNLRLKKTWLRVVSIIMVTPLLLVSLYLLTSIPPAGLMGLLLVTIIGFIIYGSYAKRPAQ